MPMAASRFVDRRWVAAILAGMVIALSWWAWPTSQIDATATVGVRVDGPDTMVWAGTVEASPATAFDALLAAGDAGDFVVEWTGPPGQRFVHTVDGHDSTNGGWCVQVNGHDSHTSSDRQPVSHGEQVRWYWTPTQCDAF